MCDAAKQPTHGIRAVARARGRLARARTLKDGAQLQPRRIGPIAVKDVVVVIDVHLRRVPLQAAAARGWTGQCAPTWHRPADTGLMGSTSPL